jgi:hypothetical protein
MNDNYSDNIEGLKIGSYTKKQLIVLYQMWRDAVYEGQWMGGFVEFAKSKFAQDWVESI